MDGESRSTACEAWCRVIRKRVMTRDGEEIGLVGLARRAVGLNEIVVRRSTGVDGIVLPDL